jgi:hypothetical protein
LKELTLKVFCEPVPLALALELELGLLEPEELPVLLLALGDELVDDELLPVTFIVCPT